MSLADDILSAPGVPKKKLWIERLDETDPKISKEIRDIKKRRNKGEGSHRSLAGIYKDLKAAYGDKMPSDSAYNQWMQREGDR